MHPSPWDETVELEELIDSSGLGQEEVLELVELVALKSDGGGSRLSFVSHTVIQARRAARLRDTVGLNIPRHGPGPHRSGPHGAARTAPAGAGGGPALGEAGTMA